MKLAETVLTCLSTVAAITRCGLVGNKNLSIRCEYIGKGASWKGGQRAEYVNRAPRFKSSEILYDAWNINFTFNPHSTQSGSAIKS